MQVSKVSSGQMWKCNNSGEVYVVTSLYKDVLSSFALLRPVSSNDAEGNKRAKVIRTSIGEEIAGFTLADLVRK
jgi:hypothetical protein